MRLPRRLIRRMARRRMARMRLRQVCAGLRLRALCALAGNPDATVINAARPASRNSRRIIRFLWGLWQIAIAHGSDYLRYQADNLLTFGSKVPVRWSGLPLVTFKHYSIN